MRNEFCVAVVYKALPASYKITHHQESHNPVKLDQTIFCHIRRVFLLVSSPLLRLELLASTFWKFISPDVRLLSEYLSYFKPMGDNFFTKSAVARREVCKSLYLYCQVSHRD